MNLLVHVITDSKLSPASATHFSMAWNSSRNYKIETILLRVTHLSKKKVNTPRSFARFAWWLYNLRLSWCLSGAHSSSINWGGGGRGWRTLVGPHGFQNGSRCQKPMMENNNENWLTSLCLWWGAGGWWNMKIFQSSSLRRELMTGKCCWQSCCSFPNKMQL